MNDESVANEFAEMSVDEVLSKFEEMNNDAVRIVSVCKIMEEAGLEPVTRRTGKGEVTYYVGDDFVFAVRRTPEADKDFDFTIMDRKIYEKYIVNCDGTFCFNKKGSVYRPITSYTDSTGQRYSIPFHKLVLQEKAKKTGIKLKDVVDHRFSDARINTFEALRPVTRSENKGNTRYLHKKPDGVKYNGHKMRAEEAEQAKFGKYAYNPVYDFRETWYAYVLCRMLGVMSFNDVLEYNKRYWRKNEKALAYYKNALK